MRDDFLPSICELRAATSSVVLFFIGKHIRTVKYLRESFLTIGTNCGLPRKKKRIIIFEIHSIDSMKVTRKSDRNSLTHKSHTRVCGTRLTRNVAHNLQIIEIGGGGSDQIISTRISQYFTNRFSSFWPDLSAINIKIGGWEDIHRLTLDWSAKLIIRDWFWLIMHSGISDNSGDNPHCNADQSSHRN